MKIDVNDGQRIRDLYLQCALLGNKAYIYPDGTVIEKHREDGCCPFPSENAFAITPADFTDEDFESIDGDPDDDWAVAVGCYLEEHCDFLRLDQAWTLWLAEMDFEQKRQERADAANHLRAFGFEDSQTERICEDESVKANGYGEIMRLKDPAAIAVLKELIPTVPAGY